MKALVCEQLGPPENLKIKDIPSPVPNDDQVLIQVKACGLNFPDTLLIQGKYQFKPDLPFSPGGEMAGIVKSVGKNVTHLQVGQRVFAGSGWGGFATEALVDGFRAFPIPDDLDFVTAAATIYTFGTVYHALVDRANIQAGEKLLVLGAAGGIGIASLQLGQALGAELWAAASSDEKLEICRQNGASQLINYEKEDLKERIKALSKGKGVDIIMDPVGGKYANPALRGMAWNGRYLVVGFTAGDIPAIPLNLPLLKACQIVGVFWGLFGQKYPMQNLSNIVKIIAWLKEGKIKPHIQAVYPLAQAPEAIRLMMERKVMGKIVIDMEI